MVTIWTVCKGATASRVGLLRHLYGLGRALAASLLLAAPALAQQAENAEERATAARIEALTLAHAAVVGVRATAVDGAGSIATLGRERSGSGVVIGADGLVLTIGYLILEAEDVELRLDGERRVPARVVAYDTDTGFGLLQALAPLRRAPVPMGASGAQPLDEALMIATGGGDGGLSLARLVSRRDFSGYWEYHIEGALFTSPPRTDHSGAALFNAEGQLLGIGSLLVSDTLGPGQPRLPGNMFVPVDLLKPILGELRERGASRRSTRAWLGVNCVEYEGQVRVLRVVRDSPADAAGLQPGDQILALDGTEVATLERLYKTLWTGGAPERDITVDVRRGPLSLSLTVHALDRAQTLRRASGI